MEYSNSIKDFLYLSNH